MFKKPSTPPEHKRLIETMLNALETPSKPLTKWEENFLESLSQQYDERGSLSDRQVEILTRIYSEKF